MFSTVNFRNEKKQHQKSKEEHKRIFFSTEDVTCNKVILYAFVFEGLGAGGHLRNGTELPLTYSSVNHEVTSFEGTPV